MARQTFSFRGSPPLPMSSVTRVLEYWLEHHPRIKNIDARLRASLRRLEGR